MPTDDELRAAKAAAKAQCGGIDGVVGFGIGDGTVRVYLLDQRAVEHLPPAVNGIPLEPVITGEITAY